MIVVHEGDCRAVLASLSAASLDACITDPPYHLTTGKRGGSGPASASSRTPQGRSRIGTGFMGKAWDGGTVAADPATWAAVLRVLKPGAHLLAFGATRTYHRMTCAIEDAGFEIRDCIRSEQEAEAWPGWLYGCGMPKSRDMAKAIDIEGGTPGTYGEAKSKAHAGWIERGRMRGETGDDGWQRPWMADPDQVANAARRYIPGSLEATAWQGWGTGLKPAWEPIVVARKPFRGTVASNVLLHGTGALHIDACRIEANGRPARLTLLGGLDTPGKAIYGQGGSGTGSAAAGTTDLGRWPANVVHDGSDQVEAAFAAAGARGAASPVRGTESSAPVANGIYDVRGRVAGPFHADRGSPSRFFFSGKATKAHRAGSKHPTVKPIPILQHLVRLVTPPGGVVLDPFAGCGTLGAAALLEGFGAVLIERDPDFAADCRRRFVPAPLELVA